jgi:hypothetical protein
MISPTCAATTAAQISCTFYYTCPLISCLFGTGSATFNFTLNGTAANVGMALRQLNPATPMTNVNTAGRTASAVLNANGSAAITLTASTTVNYNPGSLVSNLICGLPLLSSSGCGQANIIVPILLLADHPILDTSTTNAFAWFLRNNWQEVTYYAVAPGYTPNVLASQPSCTTGGTCLNVTNVSNKLRAFAILMGRSVNGDARPSTALADYLEFGNASGSYEKQNVRDSVRYIVPDTGGANAYTLPLTSVSVGQPIVFRAANANTGASTLNTPATGVKNLVNPDGSNLNSSQIQANAAVQVGYDGTKFVLYAKRPFNDRFVVIDSN